MKKVSIIAVAVIFLLSIFTVGFLGMAFHIYNPVVYVEKIEWVEPEKTFKNIPNTQIIYKSEESPADAADAFVILKNLDLAGDKKITFNLKFMASPATASETKLSYYMKEDASNRYEYEVLDDNSCSITYYEKAGSSLRVSTIDGSNLDYRLTFVFA